jgi:predicted dinucleotide-binding enzyme
MTTAIIGVGRIASALARNLVRGRERVILVSRNPAIATALAQELGASSAVATAEEAIRAADVVVIAAKPFSEVREIVDVNRDLLDGKVIVDPSNRYALDQDDQFVRILPEGQSSGAMVEAMLPAGAHFVKAFGTLGFDTLAGQAFRTPDRVAMFYATDDDEAATAIERMIISAGFDPVRAGGLKDAGRLELPDGDLHQWGGLQGRVLDANEARAAVAGTRPSTTVLAMNDAMNDAIGREGNAAARCDDDAGARRAGASTRWPELPLAEWQETRDTLQLLLQIVGKVRLVNTPLVNHWWNVPLYVTARGLTTSLMQHAGGESFQIDFNLRDHHLDIVTTSGRQRTVPLHAGPVRGFYREVMATLDELGLHTHIWAMPVEIEGAIPFDVDNVHSTYEPAHAHRFWQALTAMLPAFTEFRCRYLGKASPVHLFWGGLDLAVTRFSGRTAPPHPGGAPNCGPHVMREAYSHEVSSCGYWPGCGPEGVFYSYAYPEPPGFATTPVRPAKAHWSRDYGEFLLPYETVRESADPEATLLTFLQSTYDAAADTARWDRARLERPAGTIDEPAHPPSDASA